MHPSIHAFIYDLSLLLHAYGSGKHLIASAYDDEQGHILQRINLPAKEMLMQDTAYRPTLTGIGE